MTDELTVGEAFPTDDPVAPFVVAMCMAHNDVTYSIRASVKANEQDAPEFTYLVRLATAHVFEAAAALQRWRSESEDVSRFLRGLPHDAHVDLKLAVGVAQMVGGSALEHSRNHTFHYPHPDPGRAPDASDSLKAAMLTEQGIPLTVELSGDRPRIPRMRFADDIAMTLAFGKHSQNLAEGRAQFERTLDGALAFSRFAQRVLDHYLHDRGLPTLRGGGG